MGGQIRVVSKRKGGFEPTADEWVVDVDRTHPILGNRHILHNHLDDRERDEVIGAYKDDLDRDLAKNGPMFRALLEMSARVSEGEHLALRCWCAPRKCHAELLASVIAELAKIEYEPPPRPGEERQKASKRQMGLF